MPNYNIRGQEVAGQMMAMDFLRKLKDSQSQREYQQSKIAGSQPKDLRAIDYMKKLDEDNFGNELSQLNQRGVLKPGQIRRIINDYGAGKITTGLQDYLAKIQNPGMAAAQEKYMTPKQKFDAENLRRQRYQQKTGQAWNDTGWTPDIFRRWWSPKSFGQAGETPEYLKWVLEDRARKQTGMYGD